MALVTTDAVVLHSFPYLESSRILRLATRDAGVVSVLAKGARRTPRRFGTAIDLFAEGEAQFHTKPGRELHTLAAFDVVTSRSALSDELGRFAAASAVAELMLRFARDDTQPALYDALRVTLTRIEAAAAASTRELGVAGAWHLIAELGFAPTLRECSECDAHVPLDVAAAFSHASGGTVCSGCARMGGLRRTLPSDARAAIDRWVRGEPAPAAVDLSAIRAHQRLVREFLREHLTDGRPLRAFEAWESDRWG